MAGILGGLFDFNHDGEMNAFERAAEFAFLDEMMKVFFTLIGTKYYFGDEFLEKGMKLELEKEADNEHDKEAIVVKVEGLGKVGYVANSPYTIIGESMSAGRVYDKIGDTAVGEVMFVTTQGVL